MCVTCDAHVENNTAAVQSGTDSGNLWREAEIVDKDVFNVALPTTCGCVLLSCFQTFHFISSLTSTHSSMFKTRRTFLCVVTNLTLALFCPVGGPSLATLLFLQTFIFGITPFALRGRCVLESRAHKLFIEWITQYLNCVTFRRHTVLSFATKWVFVTQWWSYVKSDMVWNRNRLCTADWRAFWSAAPVPTLFPFEAPPTAGNVIVTHIHNCTYNKNIHMHT